MSLHQLDFFEAVPTVPGLRLARDFVSEIEGAALAVRIDAEPLSPFRFQRWEGKRLTASFGFAYDFERGRVLDAPPIPQWLMPLRERAAAFAGVAPADFVQALLIRYDPGAGIGWHKDRPQFGKVVGISLGEQVTLRMRRRTDSGFARRAVPLSHRSVYLLDGEVRREWEHSIVPVQRTRRSITFRTLA